MSGGLESPSRLRAATGERVNHAPGMIEGLPGAIPTRSPEAAGLGVGARFQQAVVYGESASPPPAQFQVNDAPHRSGQAGGMTDLKLASGRGEE